MIRRTLASLIVGLSFGGLSLGDDWPQWMGPNRDGRWNETGIIDSIPKSGLPVLWRVPIGGGYSGPAISGGRVLVTDYQAAQSRCEQ